MLKVLRKKRNMKIILWMIVVVIVISFVFWGAGRTSRGGRILPRYAGTIFGRKVSIERYGQSYHACYNQALMTYGQELPKIINYLNLEEQAWNRLILLKEASREKIIITDEEVVGNIKNALAFQEEGQFDQKRYKFILTNYFKTSPRLFEEETRQTMKIAKVINDVIKDVTISDQELKDLYKQEKEEIKVTYLIVEPKEFKDKVEADESQIKKYYDKNKEDFKTQPQVDVEYMPINIELTRDKVQIDEEELKEFYENNKESFKKQPKNKEAKESEEEKIEYKSFEEVKNDIKNTLTTVKAKDLALDTAVKVNQELRDTENFEKVAKDNSITIKETGFFSASQSIPEIGWNYQFLNAAFDLNEKEISDIIELPDGYYILRLKIKKNSYVPEYEEIKDKVKEAYILEESLNLAKEKTEEYQKLLQDNLKEGKNFEEALKLLSDKLKPQTTDFFTRGTYVPGIGKSEEFIESVFLLKENEISDVINVQKGYCIVVLEEFKLIDEEEFLKDKEEFKEKAFKDKQMEVYEEWFENLKEKAKLKSLI